MTQRNLVLIIIIMLITSVLVAAASVGGTLWYVKSHQGESGTNFSLPFGQPENLDPVFHPLEKLVLSVKGERQTHFIMMELALETRRPEAIEGIDNYMPVIQNALLKLFSDKTYEQLQNQRTIDELQNEVKGTLMNAFDKTRYAHTIDNVLLTKYVIQ
ncbi:flagellar basal body-associated protein FliL [Photobacterium galatheae]|uniref:Flagellar protein FliL n=1 Tax=Photobacterium galatheae TaxID=1654360 RepID=A0A066RR74_9GAMM|nr:flagellar basal body-associated FliL family protein [Photobacterium galatheae]KDM91611.1 flagellar protein [Photobacterium galatheae]MCM0149684.1 flagellar basal body-associated FliL family protein [Photobacterium galatheae]